MSFTVTRKSLKGATFQGQHSWPLEATVVSTGGSPPPEIFVYKTGQDGQAAYAGDVFENIASVHDMAEYGLQPTHMENGKFVPFYRRSDLIFHCRDANEADNLWTDILEDIKALLKNQAALASLGVEEVVIL